MTPCPHCNRHVREATCPFCGATCVATRRIDLGRVARSTLFAVGAVALYDCSTVALYGFSCLDAPDACPPYQPVDSAPADDFQFNVDAPALNDAADDVTDAQPSDTSGDADADDADADDADANDEGG